MQKQHARTWGFQTGEHCRQLSFWAASNDRKAGTAILLNPYGRLKDAEAALEQHWSSHFLAITGTYANIKVLLLCIYAPHLRAHRERFYRWLGELKLPKTELVLMGGDFNCTLDERVDRSYFRSDREHNSPALVSLLETWGLMDALNQQCPDDERDHSSDDHLQNHTYHYRLPNGLEASARLDRWYISARFIPWVAQVDARHPGTTADHLAVRLQLRDPEDPIRIRKPTRVYPAPAIAQEAVHHMMLERLTSFAGSLTDGAVRDAGELGQAWDGLKVCIRQEALRLIKQRRKMNRASRKQKLRRLRRQEARIIEQERGQVTTVATLTDLLDALTLGDTVGDTPKQRTRRAITECISAGAAATQRHLFRAGGHRRGKTTKAMYARVSTKFADNEIHRLAPAQGWPDRGVHEQPDTLADAWMAVFQQTPSREENRQLVLNWLGPKGQYADELEELMSPITESEVTTAIQASKPGKSCGPDRLGNDWYRAFVDLLSPILTTLYNCWYAAGTFPLTFLEADIFCLKKAGSSTDPLNFRPLALLNTDYKLLTRILASRTCLKLNRIIHPHQNGFVPQRSIHATVDLFHAAQAAATTDPAMATALAMLLDFSKAYDSGDRKFLYAVLTWLGFPTVFVAVIRAMHDGTRVRFLANGYRSRWVLATCGIRQGCPLAPLLFIIVLEALYRRIDAEPRITGVVIRSVSETVCLKIGGYADDSACYVRKRAEVAVVVEITDVFAEASGLRLNAKKTMVIALGGKSAEEACELPEGMQVQQDDVLSRYLGVQVGTRPDPAYAWRLASKQLSTRLALACTKTATVDQRSSIAAAIIIPKLLYIGRHHWPTAAIVTGFQRRIKQFVWYSRFTELKVQGRAWLNDRVAELPRQHGGLAVPDLRLELLTMAADAVTAWAWRSTSSALVIGEVLISGHSGNNTEKVYLTPRPRTREHRPTMTWGPTMWATGVTACTKEGGVMEAAAKLEMVRALHCLTYFHGELPVTWTGRRMVMVTKSMQGHTHDAIMVEEQALNGDFCAEWAPYMNLADLALITEVGSRITVSTAFPMLCGGRRQLKDIIHWTCDSHGTLHVTALVPVITAGVRHQVRRLVTLMLLNYPQLVRPSRHCGDIRVQWPPLRERPPRYRMTSDYRVDNVSHTERHSTSSSPIRTHRMLWEHLRREAGFPGAEGSIHPHPRIARLVCLWSGKRRWVVTRRNYKMRYAAAKFKQGRRIAEERVSRWTESGSSAGTGLAALPWGQIRRVVGLNPWGEQLLLRLRHRAMSAFDPLAATVGCPHRACLGVYGVDLHHIFWSCPAATKLRDVFLRKWRAVGLDVADEEHAIFSLGLTTTPAGLLKEAGRVLEAFPDDIVAAQADIVERLTAACWAIGAAQYLHSVWRWRVAHFDELNDVSERRHTAGLEARLHTGHADVVAAALSTENAPVVRQVGRVLCEALAISGLRLQPTWPSGTRCYLVFFASHTDRDVQGCGVGVVVAQLSTATKWRALKMVHGRPIEGTGVTPHVAAQIGLLQGLRACRQQHWSPVHVICDNAAVVQQQSGRHPPRHGKLAAGFWKARRAADTVQVTGWSTVIRDHNSAANSLARAAHGQIGPYTWMEGTAYQPQGSQARTQSLLQGDIHQWLNVRQREATSEADATQV